MKKIYWLLLCVFFISCKKEDCKECFAEETNSTTNETKTTSLGKKCGDDLENFEEKEYVGISGPAKTYCKD